MSDTPSAGGARLVKITATYAADANVPGVLMPYDSAWLDQAGGTAQVLIEKNGVPLRSGPTSGAGIEVYPGSDPAAGDIKTASGLAIDDLLTISYVFVRYAEIPGA